MRKSQKQSGVESVLGLVNPEIRKQRWDVCNVCEHLTNLRRCGKCGCILKIKIIFGKMSCPIGKWGSA